MCELTHGMAGERHGHGMGTACCVWIRLYCLDPVAVHYRYFSFRVGYNWKSKRPKTHDNILSSVALWPDSVSWPSLTGLCDHKHWTHTLGRTPLDEWSAPLSYNTQRPQKKSTLPAGFEPAIPTSEQPQTHAIDRATTGIGHGNINVFSFFRQTMLLRRSQHYQKHFIVYVVYSVTLLRLSVKNTMKGPSNCYVPCRCAVCNVTLCETLGACGLPRVVGGDTVLSCSVIWRAGLLTSYN
jgi:ferredoxin